MKKLKLWRISLLAMFLMTGCGSGQNAQKYTSLVTLDINPSIQLQFVFLYILVFNYVTINVRREL